MSPGVTLIGVLGSAVTLTGKASRDPGKTRGASSVPPGQANVQMRCSTSWTAHWLCGTTSVVGEIRLGQPDQPAEAFDIPLQPASFLREDLSPPSQFVKANPNLNCGALASGILYTA